MEVAAANDYVSVGHRVYFTGHGSKVELRCCKSLKPNLIGSEFVPETYLA